MLTGSLTQMERSQGGGGGIPIVKMVAGIELALGKSDELFDAISFRFDINGFAKEFIA